MAPKGLPAFNKKPAAEEQDTLDPGARVESCSGGEVLKPKSGGIIYPAKGAFSVTQVRDLPSLNHASTASLKLARGLRVAWRKCVEDQLASNNKMKFPTSSFGMSNKEEGMSK